MQLTLEQYESIQNYLDGIMTPQEEKEFLIELNHNTSLKENFEFEKELRQNLSSLLDKKKLFDRDNSYFEVDADFDKSVLMRNLIEKSGNEWGEENKKSSIPGENKAATIHDKTQLRKTKIISMQPWIISAAAACTIIAVISLKWFIPKSSFSPFIVQTNDTSLIKKDTNTATVMRVSHDSVKNIKSQPPKVNFAALFKKYHAKDTASPRMPNVLAMVPGNYKSGDYSFQQINLNNQPLTRGSAKDINSRQNILQLGHYYNGLSYIETNDNKKAIENLQWIVDSAQSMQLKIKAQWYLALVYLKEYNTRKALPLLSSLSKNTNEVQYHIQATEILETLIGQRKNKR